MNHIPSKIDIPEDFNLYKNELTILERLIKTPVQTLLLEGGSESARLNLALYWSILQNCEKAEFFKQTKPCLSCKVCNQLLSFDNSDLLIFDGRISNKMDEEQPGLIKALTVGNIRQLKSIIGSEPRNLKKRVSIFQGLTQLREEALNSLLKILEEPIAHTCFVLLVPQREQLLSTLVSRSLCITLPWKKNCNSKKTELGKSLALFLQTGDEFLEKISLRGKLDTKSAEDLLMECQAALLSSLYDDMHQSASGDLEKIFFTMKDKNKKILQIQTWINETLEMLKGAVNPVYSMAAFSSRLFALIHDKI